MLLPDIDDSPCRIISSLYIEKPISLLGYFMVEDYTCRQMTFRSDCLPGVSGVALRVAEANKPTTRRHRCCAGAWEDDLLMGLLWSCCSRKISSCQTVYYCPSWS